MSVYFMANILISNDQDYKLYLDRSEKIFARFNGTYLAVDSSPKILEGGWAYSRAVLISFARQEDFDAWYRSDEYQKILQYRLSASECDTILIQGK
jgi:uncharacterized protein (DUF1330 family)